MVTVTYSYSFDEEHFSGDFETPEAAVEDCFFNYGDVDSVYVGIRRNFKAHDFIDANYLLEKISDEAYNEVGEAALPWLTAIQESKEKREAFKKMLGDWLEANAPVQFFAVAVSYTHLTLPTTPYV